MVNKHTAIVMLTINNQKAYEALMLTIHSPKDHIMLTINTKIICFIHMKIPC